MREVLHRDPTQPQVTTTQIERLTAVDLDDCIALLDHCAATGARVDRERVLARLAALAPAPDAGRRDRRGLLEESLRSPPG